LRIALNLRDRHIDTPFSKQQIERFFNAELISRNELKRIMDLTGKIRLTLQHEAKNGAAPMTTPSSSNFVDFFNS